jgi:SAM-dependent methyltransferase
MTFVDKSNLLARLPQLQRVALELGCGSTKRDPAAIGIDALDLDGVDLVGDVFEVLAAFPEASVDSVASYHFVEHVDDLPRLIGELARVVRAGGVLTIVVPHFSNPYFYSDYTHRRFFGLYTFCYLAHCALFRRTVPTYGADLRFDVEEVELGFKSTRPFYVRHAIKRVFGLLFNASRWLQELYEENLCWLVPCYEIRYALRRIPGNAALPLMPYRRASIRHA